jgi:small conductance mechanosensitive channel
LVAEDEDQGKGGGEPRDPGDGRRTGMPAWMFETRTDAWHRVGLADEISPDEGPKPWPRLIFFALATALVLVIFFNRRTLFPGLFPDFGTEFRIITAILLFAFGWGFASAFGRTVTPAILRRMDPGTAGSVAFAIRIVSVLVIAALALRIAGVNPQTILLGGAFTAVILGLAAQQTLGNIFAGVVLQGTRPFLVGERVRLTGAQLAGSIEGTVGSLGLFYTSLVRGDERVLIPNSLILLVAVTPLREPEGIDIRARFDSHVTPIEVQRMLEHAITVPTLRPPSIWLEEVDRRDVIVRIAATPVNPADGAKLAEEIISVTRGTFEYEKPSSVGHDD